MSGRTEQLAQRRKELQMRCALQRQEVAYLNAHVEAKLASADRVIGAVSTIARNPAALVGTIAFVLIAGPWRIMKWASQAMMVFKLATTVRQLVNK